MATFIRCRVRAGYHTRAQVRRGARSWSRTFTTKKAAVAWSRAFEADLDAGRSPGAGAGHTLVELIGRYKATVLPDQKAGAQVAARLDRWVELLADRPLSDITPRDLAEARDVLSDRMAAGSVRRYLSALSGAYNRAIKDWQWLSVNPVRAIIWPREPRGRVRYLSDDELVRLRKAARVRSTALADLIDLALLTGMRRGEILGLAWSAVDWLHSRVLLLDTKNGERRQVPLADPAMAVLRSRRPAGASGSVLVFCRRGRPHRALDLRVPWAGALLDAGIRDFRFHDLRHTAASYLAMTGATSNQIAEILGHKTLAMVKRYAHLSVENQADALGRLADRLLPAGQSAR